MINERSTTSHLIVFIPLRLPSMNDILKMFHHNGVLIENMERPIHFVVSRKKPENGWKSARSLANDMDI